jgi:hypothetical protein
MKILFVALWLSLIVSGFCIIEKVFVIPFSHQDIGFTATQQKVADKYVEVYNDLLSIMESFPDFKFTVETFWQFEQWLSVNKDKAKLRKFIELAKEGRLEFCAAYGSMHSGFSNCFILENAVKDSLEFADKHGFSIETCMMNDVPGFCADLPDILARNGISYFVSGINDKYGRVLDLPYPANIFFWEGPGGEKVLTWVTKNSYMEGVLFKNIFFLLSYLEELEKSGYPYDAVGIMVASDNGGYEPGMIAYLEMVKDMKLQDIDIKISTPTEFMEYMDEHYADSLPVYSGDWSGWWEIVKTGSPYSASLARWTQEFSSLYFENFGMSVNNKLDDIINNLLLYGEHTASCGAGWPGNYTFDETMIFNDTVVNFAKDAHYELTKLLKEKFTDVIEMTTDEILVLNLLSDRTAKIRFGTDNWDPNISFILSDGDEEYISTPFTLDATDAWNPIKKGYECFVPLNKGLNRFEILRKVSYKENLSTTNIIENDYYIVTVFSDGTFSLFDKQQGKYLGKNLGYLEKSFTPDVTTTEKLRKTGVMMKSQKIFEESVKVMFDEDSFIKSFEIILPKKEKSINIKYTIDRSKLPYVNYNKHSLNLYVCFPFDGDYSTSYSGPCSVVKDYHKFPSIRPEFVAVRDFVSLAEEDFNLTVGTRQAFMFSYNNEILRFHILRHYSEAATKDKGITELPVIEPGTPDKIIFDFCICSGAIVEKQFVKEFIAIPICSFVDLSESMEDE